MDIAKNVPWHELSYYKKTSRIGIIGGIMTSIRDIQKGVLK
jgi:hypothetical protein